MFNHKAFPKIHHIGKRHIANLFDGEVEITEKLDGSQFSFGSVKGELFCRSKGAIQDPVCPDKMFEEICTIVHEKFVNNELPDGFIFYGEYFRQPHHNTLKYDRIPKNHFALFGVYKVFQDIFLSNYENLQFFADQLGFDVIPLLFKGKIESAEELKSYLDKESALGGPKMEGIVVKRYEEYLIGSEIIPLMAGKYVSEEFKEVHIKEWKGSHTGKGKFDSLLESYKTTARWEKAVQHLREKGELKEDLPDIGPLMKEVQMDIVEEEKEEIKDRLWSIFKDQILRYSVKGFPDWYKRKLLDSAFEDDLLED